MFQRPNQWQILARSKIFIEELNRGENPSGGDDKGDDNDNDDKNEGKDAAKTYWAYL